jgi:hypothetical protein
MMLALLLENILVALHEHSSEIDLHFDDRSMYYVEPYGIEQQHKQS